MITGIGSLVKRQQHITSQFPCSHVETSTYRLSVRRLGRISNFTCPSGNSIRTSSVRPDILFCCPGIPPSCGSGLGDHVGHGTPCQCKHKRPQFLHATSHRSRFLGRFSLPLSTRLRLRSRTRRHLKLGHNPNREEQEWRM